MTARVERSCVGWGINIHDGKGDARPFVVIGQEDDGTLVVCWGTGSTWRPNAKVIEPDRRIAGPWRTGTFRITKPTAFYPEVARLPIGLVRAWGTRVLPTWINELETTMVSLGYVLRRSEPEPETTPLKPDVPEG